VQHDPLGGQLKSLLSAKLSLPSIVTRRAPADDVENDIFIRRNGHLVACAGTCRSGQVQDQTNAPAWRTATVLPELNDSESLTTECWKERARRNERCRYYGINLRTRS